MTTMRMLYLTPLMVAGFTACGGDDAGDGSNTLFVDAKIEANERVSNATDPTEFDTTVEVRVRRDGSAVSGATVIVYSDRGEIQLTEGNSGEYHGSQNGYAREFSLDVESGDDFLQGVHLTGPTIHAFAEPTQGGTHPANTDMLVRWSPGDADRAEIEAATMNKIIIEDTGSYTVAGNYLEADAGDVEEERIELWRSNVILPAGTTTGSEVRITVRNRLDIQVVGP
jgi:hypothetical protein